MSIRDRNMTEETPYGGIFVKKADPLVLADLDQEGKLFDAPKFEQEMCIRDRIREHFYNPAAKERRAAGELL